MNGPQASDQPRAGPISHPTATGVCGHTRTGATGITWICIARDGPPPGALRGPHTHYYVNRHPHRPRQEQQP